MKKALFTTEQIIEILQEQAAGAESVALVRRHGISKAPLYHWMKRCRDQQVSDSPQSTA
ncbi:MAG: hypothetical protein C0497_12895 [Gemmatimonas sp.]|nr:hypothetical protein [Gemmatimonas sp.]